MKTETKLPVLILGNASEIKEVFFATKQLNLNKMTTQQEKNLTKELRELLDDNSNYTSSYTGTLVFFSDRAIPKIIALLKAKNISFNLPVSGSAFSPSGTTKKEGYYTDNYNTYYIDSDGKKHLR